MTNTNKLPFEGITVVALEQAVAAPLCTGRLAEAGARVIKIERKGGDFARNYDHAAKGESSYFVWLNQGKESLELDLKNTDDQALLMKIISQSDVLIQNLAPGATERLGFGSEQLRAKFPKLITCDISGYGDSGSYQHMKAYDFLVQCETGLVSVNGAAEAPGRVGVSVCDIGAGMNALIGIQQALFLRQTSGLGSGIKVSLFDTLSDWMMVPAIHEEYGEGAPAPAGMRHPSIAPYGGFESADGQTVALSIQNEREWVNLCENVLGDKSIAEDERFNSNNNRVKNRPALDGLLQAFFKQLSTDEMCEKLLKANIAFGKVNSVRGLLNHPQLRKKNIALHNGASIELIASPIQSTISQNEAAPYVPKSGEHNDALRREFS